MQDSATPSRTARDVKPPDRPAAAQDPAPPRDRPRPRLRTPRAGPSLHATPANRESRR